ncbi:MAG: S-methyl-5-thioribose-1-phosphate isomerase [Chloroflexi bacterium]|nr:S-methyl-5-thioribose-1-phosphate isomerase [Chloroflexota bacterium]
MTVKSLEWRQGCLRLLDQTLLPQQMLYLECTDHRAVVEAIRTLRVRGAPAIGVAGAYALVLAAKAAQNIGLGDMPNFFRELEDAAREISKARPTAVNLAWAVNRTLQAARGAKSPREATERLLSAAQRLEQEDQEANRQIGENGAVLVPPDATVLTHCNTGSLATAGYGTALGVVRSAWAQGRVKEVVATETRPLLQGARLTTWELVQEGIPVTLVVDSAVGHLLALGRVTCIIVGADRIAANGDVANKIGTYTLATLAKEHRVPFYVAAPTSTVDITISTGKAIPIEERGAQEVLAFSGTLTAPVGVKVYNPAFDVTPAQRITAIVTERGVARPPYGESLRRLVQEVEEVHA